jgi:hypothetical protein
MLKYQIMDEQQARETPGGIRLCGPGTLLAGTGTQSLPRSGKLYPGGHCEVLDLQAGR